mmetsp:Transcript_29009/g.55641  ORF Transcript_29009/g.55641 Transcript_29009/m.55641 type:complete len:235 (-) Transcript_29009:1967-2671(-)
MRGARQALLRHGLDLCSHHLQERYGARAELCQGDNQHQGSPRELWNFCAGAVRPFRPVYRHRDQLPGASLAPGAIPARVLGRRAANHLLPKQGQDDQQAGAQTERPSAPAGPIEIHQDQLPVPRGPAGAAHHLSAARQRAGGLPVQLLFRLGQVPAQHDAGREVRAHRLRGRAREQPVLCDELQGPGHGQGEHVLRAQRHALPRRRRVRGLAVHNHGPRVPDPQRQVYPKYHLH